MFLLQTASSESKLSLLLSAKATLLRLTLQKSQKLKIHARKFNYILDILCGISATLLYADAGKQ
jgi:hypothetical protein